MSVFRAFWPIIDQTIPLRDLIAEASDQLPALIAQAHCHVTGRGRWSVTLSSSVPGSGRITETVLLYEAPARPAPRREYHRATGSAA